MISSSMRLLSSKKRGNRSNNSLASSESSVRKPKRPPPPPKPSQQQSDDAFSSSPSAAAAELLQLRLENSELRARLDDALSHTDESKAELLQLLEEETSQATALQHKCDELHRGFVAIDKERRALRRSADDARSEAGRQVERTREECERRCGQLERHLRMREKEVEALAERIREQERRIEAADGESGASQARVEELEGELEGLIVMVENERAALRGLKEDYERVRSTMRERDGQLEEGKRAEEGLERQLEDMRHAFQEEGSRWKRKEEQLAKEVLEKAAEVANLLQDQQLSKIEHEQAIQTTQDETERQRADFESQHKDDEDAIAAVRSELQDARAVHEREASDLHRAADVERDETSRAIVALQAQLDAQSVTIEQLHSDHAASVAEMETTIRECKEGARAIEKTQHAALEANAQLQQELTELHSSTQLAHADLKAANHLLEKENGEMAEDLDQSRRQLAEAHEQCDRVQTECTALQQQLDGTQGQLAATSERIQAFLAEHETLQSEHAALQRSQARLTEGWERDKAQLVETNEQLSGVRTDHAALQQHHSNLEQHVSTLEHDREQTKADHEVELTQMSNQMAAMEHALNEEKSSSCQLRVQLEETASAQQAEATELHRELESVREDLSMKKHEVDDRNEKLTSFRTECKTLLHKHASLQQELDGTTGRLVEACATLTRSQSQHALLQSEYDASKQGQARLERQMSTLETRTEQQISAIERRLHEEQSASHELRSQLRGTNLQSKEDGAAHQKDMHALERKLESVCKELATKKNAAKDLSARVQADATEHAAELESMRTDHTAQIMAIETRGADVVSDLEDVIEELEKELASRKSDHENAVTQMQQDMQAAVVTARAEKERVERSLADKDRKVTDLTSYAKQRKEGVKTVKNELARVHFTLENVRSEMQDARALHEREVSDLQHVVDAVRAELSVARERLASEDGELGRAKATLSERTNLLREMVIQTTAYQGDYEREHARARQLDDAATGYKRQLVEERDAARRLEREIHDKDTHYCEAIHNERQQRQALESERDAARQATEEALRRHADAERDAAALKDKIARQEKYIGRLQDKGKQTRRPTSTFQGHRGLQYKAARPATADACRSSHKERAAKPPRSGYPAADENDSPNIGQFGFTGTQLTGSPDELGSLLGR